jgi:hypothetical protein
MKQWLRYALAGGLLLVAFGVVGCGGSDGEEATAEADQPTMIKAIYIEKGDKICQANYAKRGKVLSSLSQKYSGGKNLPPQAKLEAILVNQVMPIFREESEELNELPLPDEGTEEAEKILAALEKSIEGVEADPARSLSEGTGVEFKEAERLAHEYGFKWCGRS